MCQYPGHILVPHSVSLVAFVCRAATVLREELEGLRKSLQPNELQELPQQELDPPRIHPNDHVNMGQSSNDTIPTVRGGEELATITPSLKSVTPILSALTTGVLVHLRAEKARQGRPND